MDIKKEREAFEKSKNVHPDWSFKFDYDLEQYIAVDHEMQIQVDEFNEHLDTFRAGWLAAKQQAIPDGFVVVPVEPTERMLDCAYSSISDNLHYADLENIYRAMTQEFIND